MKQELKSPFVGTSSPVSSIRNAIRNAAIARKDERLGSELGWLNVRRSITQRQYEAGIAFAKLAEKHAAAGGAPAHSVANGAVSGSPEQTPGRAYDERTKDILVQYALATGPLRRAGVLGAVTETCVNNKLPSDLPGLRRGLDMLADWLRLPGAK